MIDKKLIGREVEIAKIDRILVSGRPEFLAVYGRRRVGKTFLIRQHLKSNLVFDLTGLKDGTIEQQLLNFSQELNKRSRKKFQVPKNWSEAFYFLNLFLEKIPVKKQKMVVFIDEMPWIDTPKSSFISALEYLWNQNLSNMNHVLLVACGSASSWIKQKLINARGGLYGRVTQRIQLMPFNLYETELYLKSMKINLSHYQILEIYMAMGGIPFYLKELQKGKSATQLIDEICFSPQGLLRNEYLHLYHSLFKNADNHINVIESLATKPRGMTRNELLLRTKLSQATLNRTLEELEECDFISNYLPLINKKKLAIYKLTDLYTLFYLKFIKPNKQEGKGTWEQLSKKSTYVAWSGYAFENICMLHLTQVKKALGISGVYCSTGSWVFKGDEDYAGTQIDMIIDRADFIINLCEAKFTKGNYAITKSYAVQLQQKKWTFMEATKSKKATFTTLLTTFPAIKNSHYLGLIDSEITMDKLFLPE